MVLKRGLVFFLAVTLLVISSCADDTQGFGVSPKVLNFEFLEDYPQDDLSEGEEFQVGVKIYNDLIEPVVFSLCIRGDRPDFFGGVPASEDCISDFIEEAYEGTSGIIPSEKTIYFPSETSTYSYHDLDESIEDVNIYAELDYPVDSLSSAEVCILDNPNLQDDIDCEAEEIIGASDIQQKAYPLIVSKIEKDIKKIAGKSKIDLKIYLDKASEGDIVKKDDSQFHSVILNVSLSGTEAEFICKKREGKIIFVEGDPIECVADLNFEGSSIIYKDSLNINLGYSYKSVKSKKIVLDIDQWDIQ